MAGTVRDATSADAAACAELYEPYVLDTAITFEIVPPSVEEMARRIETAQREHAWLVAESGGEVVGFANAGQWKSRAAYHWTCEVGIYLRLDHRGRGAGRLLYERLLERLTERGFRTVVAGMTEPNEASHALHRAMGFVVSGTLRRVGWKDGRWLDVTMFDRTIGGGAQPDDAAPGPRG